MALKTDITSTYWTFDMNNPGKLVQGLECIKQCIQIILTTSRGTDPLRPDFGCGVYDYLDQPVNVAVPRMILSIQESIKKYETRVDTVKVNAVLAMEHVTFKITYNIKNTTINDQIDITYGRGSSTNIL